MTDEFADFEASAGDVFERAYLLPEEYPDDLKALHTEILFRMRNEARAVPMGTVQHLLIAQIAYYFVVMKYQEQTRALDLNPKETKEMNAFWLSMTQEFNRVLSVSQSKANTALISELGVMLKTSAGMISDTHDRQKVTTYWDVELKRMDV